MRYNLNFIRHMKGSKITSYQSHAHPVYTYRPDTSFRKLNSVYLVESVIKTALFNFLSNWLELRRETFCLELYSKSSNF